VRRSLTLTLLLAACGHSDPTGLAELTPLGPIQPATHQVTQPLSGRTAARWTPDGQSILYTYATTDTRVPPIGSTPATINCLAMIPRDGGTVRWTWCDTRGSHRDSVDVFGVPALGPGGQLLFLQAVYARPRLPNVSITTPASTVLWAADTADPSARRRKLFQGPVTIGDSAISWIDQPGWIDHTTFYAIAQRFIAGAPGAIAPQPKYLVRGTVTAGGTTLTQVPGTLQAMAWTTAPNGDIVFIPGRWWTVQGGQDPGTGIRHTC